MAMLGKAVVASLAALLVHASALAADTVEVAAAETSSRWFVELASPPSIEGTSPAVLRAEKDAFRREARGLGVKERFAFDRLWNGLSVEVPRGEAGRLARIAGVKAVYPVETYRIPETSPSVPDLLTALSLTGADAAQSALGLTGKGVRVAVMDTGLDYDHAAFGGDGVARSNSAFWAGPGGTNPASRVVAGFDFVGDAYDANVAGATPVPDAFPDDCNGHGSHVAGIVGATRLAGEFEPGGVAPGVVFGAYRVFGCNGSTDSDIMIAAMERALEDGMDVLNMSIGSAFQWPQYPTAVAASRLVNRGMVVVASIGNSGANGIWSLGAPGVGANVIGVASYDNVQNVLPTFTIPQPTATDPAAVRVVGYDAAAGLAPGVTIPTEGTVPLARTGTTTTTNDACNGPTAPAPGSLAGRVALVRRGTCSFHEKAKNAQGAGAVGVVLYNNVAGRLSPTVAPPTPADPLITIPVVMVTNVDGAAIDAAIAAGGVSMTWTDVVAAFPNATVGLASSFTSYGFSPDLSMKPDIAAPGGFIWSTFPLELGGYANLSGTSMASPHVAGAVALLLEAKPRTNPKLVRSILQNSAVPALFFGAPSLGFLDNVGRQGAGMLHVDTAIQATTLVEPASLALGESQAGPQTRTLTITNRAAAPVTYALSHRPGLAVRNTFAPGFQTRFATVAFSQAGVPVTAVTVPAGGGATVDVTVTAPAELTPPGPLPQYGGWIVLAPSGDAAALRVPYGGVVGDYQSVQVLVPTANGFPWLAKVVGPDFVNQPEGATFTLADGDVPHFLLHLDHQSRKLRAVVRDARTGRSFQDAFREEFLPRNGTATGFFDFAWDGVTVAGRKATAVPDGTYVVTFSILKALGDEANPAHWETWTSPAVTIDRP